MLLFTIIRTALPAFTQTMIQLDVTLYPQEIDPAGTRDPQALSTADYQKLIRDALDDLFPDVTDRRERRELMALLSPGATYLLREKVMADPSLIGQRVDHPGAVLRRPRPARQGPDRRGSRRDATGASPTSRSSGSSGWSSAAWSTRVFNTTLFTAGDSRSPELAGIWGVAGRLVLDDADHAGCSPSRSPSAPPSTSRNSRRRTAGPT